MTARMSSASAGRWREARFGAVSGCIDPYRGLPHEKRSSARLAFEDPVILETASGEMIGAVLFNYGHSGLYFESHYRAPEGAVLIIRNESALASAGHGGCTARVRWTRAIKGRNGEFRFGTGVQYCG